MNWKNDLSRDFGLNPAQVRRFQLLLSHVEGHADRNLTAVTGVDNIVDVHFRDSLSLLGLSEMKPAATVVDIGSGAGFPGLPLAIALPGVHFTLIESRLGKTRFILNLVGLLGLDNVQVITQRAEESGRSVMRESFDIALARAVGPMPVVLELALPLVRTGGYALLQRGRRIHGDEFRAASVAAALGARFDRIVPVKPYSGAANLHIWSFEKISPTVSSFPRRAGIPEKRPLK